MPAASALCLACGLCCDGTLFRDVELGPGDAPERLAAAGLPLRRTAARTRLPQPCAALGADRACRVYAGRPGRCRDFDCALLLAVRAGEVAPEAARRVVGETRRLADRVRGLLRTLGERREDRPLARRFAGLRRAMEAGGAAPDEAALETYAELTLAVQRLQLRLRERFYP